MSMKIRFASVLCVVSVVSVVLGAVACGGSDGTGSTRSGVTDCGEGAKCQAGQYCADPRFSECSVGCLSNTNCAADQKCVSVGDGVGKCSLDATTPPADMATTPAPGDMTTTPPPTGCGDGVCTEAERNSCAADCEELFNSALDICDGYNFFMCFQPGELQECYDAVGNATVAQRKQWVTCGASATVECDFACADYLP